MSLTLLSPPAGEPVSLAEVKAHLRVTHSDEDALIAGVLAAAARAVEARASLALMQQQWRLSLDAPPEDTLFLPLSPVSALDAVAVIDADGDPQTIATNLYEFAPGGAARLRPTGPWPVAGRLIGGVRIDFTAGYADAASIPEPLKLAVKNLAGYFYETREAAGEAKVYAIPASIDALIAPYREVRL